MNTTRRRAIFFTCGNPEGKTLPVFVNYDVTLLRRYNKLLQIIMQLVTDPRVLERDVSQREPTIHVLYVRLNSRRSHSSCRGYLDAFFVSVSFVTVSLKETSV